jgi:hypothetical protein
MTRGLTFTSAANAYAIRFAAARCGLDVATADPRRIFPLPVGSGEEAEWLFFTEEASLRRALLGEIRGRFLPARFPLELLDDKWAFAEWLREREGLPEPLRQWPLDATDVAFPCVLKAKHSWRGGRKLPRGWVCRSRQELAHALGDLSQAGLEPGWFFLQEWLDETDYRNFAVCGFYDHAEPRRNLSVVLERLQGGPGTLPNSTLVATVADAGVLTTAAARVLDALEFTGPFEIEFLVSRGRTFLLELNPRFWLQHSIFIPFGNGLMKRYLGQETAADHAAAALPAIVWVDGLTLAKSVLRMDFRLWRAAREACRARKARLVIWPSLPMTLRALGRRLVRDPRPRANDDRL